MDIDAFDVLWYLVGFWAFLFNARFRNHVLERWRARDGWQQWETFFEISVSSFCGLFPPFLLLYWWLG